MEKKITYKIKQLYIHISYNNNKELENTFIRILKAIKNNTYRSNESNSWFQLIDDEKDRQEIINIYHIDYEMFINQLNKIMKINEIEYYNRKSEYNDLINQLLKFKKDSFERSKK